MLEKNCCSANKFNSLQTFTWAAIIVLNFKEQQKINFTLKIKSTVERTTFTKFTRTELLITPKIV